jgi:hypothetical protein
VLAACQIFRVHPSPVPGLSHGECVPNVYTLARPAAGCRDWVHFDEF